MMSTRLLSSIRERSRRGRVLQHSKGWRKVTALSVIVPDKTPTAEDVAIAERLLRAFRAAVPGEPRSGAPGGTDLWTIISDHQAAFASILASGTAEQLAACLVNVSRHDASIGITQGDIEYRRIVADRSYRNFLALMAKDKLVSLAEAVGSHAPENPEQGPFGASLHADPAELVDGISQRLGISLAPPDLDGGLLKLRTDRGLFGERDLNAIFTGSLMTRACKGLEAPSLCEIGGGSGRVAYWCYRLGLPSYTIIDLPQVNVVQAYYLMRALPNLSVQLYGERPLTRPDLTIWPSFALDELPQKKFDIVLNQDSMPEMSPGIVDRYLHWIQEVCRDAFISINHESKPPYGAGLQHVSVPEAAAAAAGPLC